MITIRRFNVTRISFGAIRCDGTINCTIIMYGKELDLYGLSLKQRDALEEWYDGPLDSSLDIDSRLTVRSLKLELSQNGIAA